MTNWKFIFISCILMTFQVNAQSINLMELGLSFSIPERWTGQQQEDIIILGHETIPGMLLVFGNDSKNAQELKDLAMQGIIEDGLRLTASEDFNITSKSRIEGYYEGSYQGTPAKAFAIGLINSNGGGINILMLTEITSFSEVHILEAKKLADSVIFSMPKDSENTTTWKQLIQGVQLKYMNTAGSSDYSGGYSGTSEVVIINLCSNEQFTFYSNTDASFDDTGGFGHTNSKRDRQGTYDIYSQGNQTFLDLIFLNEDISTYELTKNEAENTLLNGRRYFVTDLEGCK